MPSPVLPANLVANRAPALGSPPELPCLSSKGLLLGAFASYLVALAALGTCVSLYEVDLTAPREAVLQHPSQPWPASMPPMAHDVAPVAAALVLFQIEPAASRSRDIHEMPDLDHADKNVAQALSGLLGGQALRSLVRADDFARRFVGTIDNFGRETAPSRLWPVRPTSGRLVLVDDIDGPHLADRNADRYLPFVRLLESVDAESAMEVYTRLYPLFEHAYEELGYSGRHFNRRVLEVVDQLLDTPEPSQPIKLVRLEAGGLDGSRWPRQVYRFADPGLESRPAGQKLLLRLGRSHASTIKAQLAVLRVRLSAFEASR